MYCVLIAGMPASGKSSFAHWLNRNSRLPYMSKDEIKEILFDEIGFQSRAGKVALGVAAEKILYSFAENQMRAGQPFILENNFDDTSKSGITQLLRQYDCTPITVLFDGDTKVLYQRFLERDQSPLRHRGHVVNTCYPEPVEGGQTPCVPNIPMTFEAFQNGMEKRGFRHFRAGGPVVFVDSTDFSKVDYQKIYEEIKAIIDEGGFI